MKIANIMLENINKRLQAKGLSIDVEDEAVDYIVAKGSNLIYGARPLKRFIEQEIEDRVAEKILLGELPDTGTIVVTLSGNELLFTEQNNA